MAENKLNDREILLVEDKRSGRLRAVAGMSEDGKRIKTVDPVMKNEAQFMNVKKGSRELNDFFKAFVAGAKNPSDTAFYRMGTNGLEQGVQILSGLINHQPDSRNVAESRIDPKHYMKPEAPKILFAVDEQGRLKVVTGGDDGNGKLKTADPTKENAGNFLQFDTHGNPLENFFKKFAEQAQHPSHTGFYAVAAGAVEKIAAFFDKIIKIDSADRVLDPYRVTQEGKMQEPAQGKFQPLDLNRLDWNKVDKMGLLGDDLAGALKAMAYGHKSPGLVDVKNEIDGQEITGKARLSLVERPDGSLEIQQHPWQEKPDFGKPFLGVQFTDEDIHNFQQSGNGGRVFYLEATPGGERVPSLVSLDRITNRFEAVPLSDIQIQQTLKGVTLSDDQQQRLKNGEGVLVEDMKKNVKPGEADTGEKITRIVQYNAAKRNFDFLFTPEQKEQHRQERQTKQAAAGEDGQPLKARKVGDVWVRPVQGGVALSPEQFNKVCAGDPVWLEGMQKTPPKVKEGAEQKVEATDKKGQKYDAWVWIDKDKGHVRHTTKHPDQQRAIEAKAAAKQGVGAKPAAGAEAQVAVNNDGKTHEPTKHAQSSGEPLKKGQTQPTAKQIEKQQRQSPAAPRKGKGRSVGQ